MAINLDHQRDKLSTTSQFLTLNTTGALILPSGTTAEATATTVGQIRYNVDTGKQHIEQYVNGSWNPVSSKEKLEELDDVTISTYGVGSEYLKYSSSTGFINAPLELTELNDVSITGTVISGQVLKYDSSNKFKPYTLELNDLSDVTIVGTPSQNKILKTNANGIFELADPYTNASFDSRFSSKDTDDLGEGTTNLYFTNERVDDRVNALFIDGTGFQTVYDDAQNKLTASVTLSAFTTSNLSEGGNLYYTNTRADARIATASLTDLTDVDATTNADTNKFLKYNGTKFVWSTVPAAYTSTNFNTDFAAKDTDDLDEGTTNLYYTNTRADARIALANLTDLTDVSIPSTPNNGQVLKWDGPNGYWEAGTDTALTIGTGAGQAMAGNTALYSTTDFNTDFNTKTTDNLSEGTTNKYASNATIRASISAVSPITYNTTSGAIGWNGDTDDVPQGTTNKYYSSTLFTTDLATKNTNNVAEGSSNLYFTNGRADARIALASLPDLADVDAVGASKDNYVLTYDHSNTKFEWLKPYDYTDFNTDFGNKDTDDLAEGTTNFYYTNTRADTRIGLAKIEDLNDVDITNRSDGMLLKWSSGVSKWVMGSDAGSTGGGSGGAGTLVGLEDTNLGTPGAAHDGLQIVWNNNNSEFIFSQGIQAAGPTQIVTVANGKFYLNGNLQQTLRIYKGFLYVFRQFDDSNDDNELYISTSSIGAGAGDYTDGVATSGVVGTDFELLFNVPMDAPVTLYYQSKDTASMGGALTIDIEGGNAYQTITVADTGSGSSSGADIVAASSSDTLTLIAGDNVSIDTSQSGADDQLTISATGGGGSSTLGVPIDTTFNDGAYYQASTTYQSGTVISGISTSGSIADALDGLNETIKNIHNNTYVQGAYFTRSPVEGGASPGTPMVVTFTIVNPGDATHMDLEFDNTTENTSYTSVTNDTTWKSAGYYDYSFTDIAGGFVDVTMTLKCQSASGTTGLTEGSYFKYKFTDAVELWTPDPEVSWTTTNGDQIVDLGSGTESERSIEFDTTNTLYAHYWMIEFGDGTQYPTSASITGGNTHVQANWIDHNAIKKYTYDYDSGGGTVTADTRWSPKVYARSITARGQVGNTQSLEKTNHIEGFITPVAEFDLASWPTGNNDEIGDTNYHGETNTQEGHPVEFTNATENLGTWGDTTYTWDWDDLTSDTTIVDSGQTEAGLPGDQIEHYFTLADDDVAETFNVTLKAQNNRENSNSNTSSATIITVNIDPRAGFSGEFVNQNTSATGAQSYVNPRIGYDFTKYSSSGGIDLTGASNIVDFTNSSAGITGTSPTYAWTFNNTQTSTLFDPPNQAFTTAQAYNIQLITQNANSYAGGTDDTDLQSNYITINATPATPPKLTDLTIAVPSSTGTSPLACADTTNNTAAGGSAPTGGSAVTRIVTTTMTSNVLSDWANEFPSNGTYAGVLTAHLNEGSATGTITFDGSNKVGTNGILEVTQERDSHARNNATYPDNFFKEFKAKVNLTGLTAGFNTVQLKHDDSTNTTMTEFVYDDMTSLPTISSFGTVTEGTGSYRYMSGIKFYDTGSTLTVTSLQISNLTGQTYRNTTSPLTISNSTGTPIVSQDFTYVNLGVNATPNKNLSPTSSPLTVSINGSGSGLDGIIKSSAKNVNGTSSDLADTTKIMYWFTTPTFDEISFVNNMSDGAASSGATDCKRIDFTWLGGNAAYPQYFSTGNYYAGSDIYTNNQWNKTTATVSGTNEAACYLDKIRWDRTDFSTGYLPIGPNLSTGRAANAPQFFTFAFKRNSITNFSIKLTGKVSSLWVAMPSAWKNFSGNPVYLDETSGSNGWFDALINGSGVPFPGVNSSGGTAANGTDTCRATNFTSNIVAGTAGTDIGTNVTFYQFNTQTGNWTILVRVGLADSSYYVDSISIEDSQDY